MIMKILLLADTDGAKKSISVEGKHIGIGYIITPPRVI